MKKEIKIKAWLDSVAVLLAAAGLWFTWHCPLDCVYGVDSGVFFFGKQLLWNVIGAAACAGAACVPWKRWLKFAPWGMLGWLSLSAVAVLSASRHGTHRWADLGPVCVNVHLVLVLAWSVFAAWLCSKKAVKPWMIFAFLAVAALLAGVALFSNANRLARLAVLFGSEDGNASMEYARMQMKSAYATACWFGDADRSLRYLPVAYADAMPSAAALIFGKWFTLAVAGLFSVFGGILTWTWLACGNPSKRMFILFWGGAVTFAAMYSFYQSVGFVPVFGFSPALAGYGGGLAVTFWIGLGILFSALSDGGEFAETTPARKTVPVAAWAVLFALFAFGVATASGFKARFCTPIPRSAVFGEFGTEAKRGEIFAADGSVLAKTVKATRVRLDPKTAREYGIASDPESVTNICPRLGLTPGELLEFCNIEKSRYVLVRDEIDNASADWFLSDRGRRLSRGFIIETFQKRVYPLGSNAVHVTGCVHSYRSGASSGASGIEHVCDGTLAGRDGILVRDAPRAEQMASGRPVHGGSVTTTVVPSMQYALAAAVSDAVGSNGAETAWGIVMDVGTGGVAAMTSFPVFNPEGKRKIENGPDYFVNNAAMTSFDPGGLFKPVKDAAAIEKGDIGRYLSAFGFGRKVGGGTVYGEWTGTVGSPESSGQGPLVTGLQIVNAYAVFANGGKTVAPHLVMKTVSTNGVTSVFSPGSASVQVVSADTARTVTVMMKDAMTAAVKVCAVDFGGVDVAGAMSRTPVSAVSAARSPDNGVCIAGFFPADKPKWVAAVGFGKTPDPAAADKAALKVFAEIVRTAGDAEKR